MELPLFLHPIFFIAIIPLLILIIYLIFKNFIIFRHDEEKTEYLARTKLMRKFVLLLRSISVILLIIALASPFYLREETVKGEASLKILIDNSTSMNIFDMQKVQALKDELASKIPVTVEFIGHDTVSPIGTGVLQSIKGNDEVLLISDGNTNTGKSFSDVVLLANSLNTTISGIQLLPKDVDFAITVDGPDEVITGTDAVFTVHVQGMQTGQYELTVTIDNQMAMQESGTKNHDFTITKKLSVGYHRIIATITTKDYFNENNVYYKTLRVVEKPKVYIFSKKSHSPFIAVMKNLYDVTLDDKLPLDLSQYSTLVLDDISIDDLPDVSKLIDYVTNGNGLIVIGGMNSFDRGKYKNSPLEPLLPVKIGSAALDEGSDIATVIVVDVSASTGGTFIAGKKVSKLEVEKALAADVANQFSGKHKVGLLVFNTEAFLLSPLSRIDLKKQDIQDTISKLVFGGGTIIASGIEEAKTMLVQSPGSRNIILISDGNTMFPQDTLSQVQQAGFGAIRTYAVGVGFDTNEAFMKQIAQVGNGVYFRPEESEKLKLVFGEPNENNNDQSESSNLQILNAHHFITEGINVTGKISGFNAVLPKSTASTLLTAGAGANILTVWRFGLGKVAALTTDDGEKFSGQLYTEENTKMLSRMMNWAIGNPGKNEAVSILEQSQTDHSLTVLIHSTQEPTGENLVVRKVDKDTYEITTEVSKPNFYLVAGGVAAVNYPDEFAHIGMQKDFEKLIESTNGKMYSINDLQRIVDHVKKSASRIAIKKEDLKWYFVLCALLIFLIEILYRRITEMKKAKS